MRVSGDEKLQRGLKDQEHPGKKSTKELNLGILIFVVAGIYLCATLIIYFTSSHISSYEVTKGSLSYHVSTEGLILRSELPVLSEGDGYPAYYQSEGNKVRVGSLIYSLDSSGVMAGVLKDSTASLALTEEARTGIENSLSDFRRGFQNAGFEDSYDCKKQLESRIQDSCSQSVLSRLYSGEFGNGVYAIPSQLDGVVSLVVDGMEGLTVDTLTADAFARKGYQKTYLRERSLLHQGEIAYKLILSDNWNIVAPIDEKAFNYLVSNELGRIQLRVEKDGAYLTADVTPYSNETGYYVKLDLVNSMVRYLSDRYLDINLIIAEQSGLKVPKSAMVEKEFYIVPSEYVYVGGESNTTGVYVKSLNKKGEEVAVFTEAAVYYKDEENGVSYLDTNDLVKKSQLMKEGSTEAFTVRDSGMLKGVFCINKGYALFKRIEIVYENEEYCIVKEGTDYGLSCYDFIALRGDSVTENELLK